MLPDSPSLILLSLPKVVYSVSLNCVVSYRGLDFLTHNQSLFSLPSVPQPRKKRGFIEKVYDSDEESGDWKKYIVVCSQMLDAFEWAGSFNVHQEFHWSQLFMSARWWETLCQASTTAAGDAWSTWIYGMRNCQVLGDTFAWPDHCPNF